MKVANIFFSTLLLIATVFMMTGCGNDEPIVQRPSEELIEEYLAANNITAQKTESGLYYVIENPGEAEKPVATSVVIIDYRGFTLDDEVFDSSYDRGQALQISLSQVITGWTEGVQLFGRGGKGTLFIPSQLAYGTRGSGASIGPNEPIAFDIELYDFR